MVTCRRGCAAVGRAYGCGWAQVRSNVYKGALRWGAVSLRKGENREEWG